MVIPVKGSGLTDPMGTWGDHGPNGSHGTLGALEIRASETICEPAGAPWPSKLRVSWAWIDHRLLRG